MPLHRMNRYLEKRKAVPSTGTHDPMKLLFAPQSRGQAISLCRSHDAARINHTAIRPPGNKKPVLCHTGFRRRMSRKAYFCSTWTASRFLPFALRFLMTLRPPGVLIRSRNPCFRARFLFFG